MGGIIGSCLGSFLGSCCCSVLGNACKTDSQSARIPYIVTYFLYGIAAVAISQWGGTTLKFPFYEQDICTDICASNGAVFRISLCLVLFFSFHVIVLFIPGCGMCHSEAFMLKFMGLIALVIASFWIDNSVMDQYADVARVFSGIFLVIQSFMLIGWAYDTNKNLYDRMQGDGDYDEPQPNLGYCIIFWCLSFVVAAIVLSVKFFGWYTNVEDCGFNEFAIIFTILFCLLCTAISVTEWCPHGNLFASSVVWFYATFILYEALASDKSACNARLQAKQSGGANMWIGIVLITLALSYAGFSTIDYFLNDGDMSDIEDDAAKAEAADGAKEDSDAKKERQNAAGVLKANILFHLIMVFGSFYMAMLLSNWGTNSNEGGSKFSTEGNLWILMTAQWLCLALYFWSLVLHVVGPYCCPDRDWDQE